MTECAAHVRGKADMTLCGNPLLRSLLGLKRTLLIAPHMSAFDPKRTSDWIRVGRRLCAIPLWLPGCKVLAFSHWHKAWSSRRAHATTPVHHASWRCSGCVAAYCACAAGGDAGDRIPEQRVAPIVRARGGRVPPGSEGSRSCRGPKHRDRIPP